MQERWANLLANAATSEPGSFKIAFPRILSEVEPAEAVFLEDRAQDGYLDIEDAQIGQESIDNLRRLGLVEYAQRVPTLFGGSQPIPVGLDLTGLGRAFVRVCSPPSRD